MNLVLDAGALIGIDRDDRRTAGLIELSRRSAAASVTTAPVLAQARRVRPTRARLARLLAMLDVRGVHLADGRAAGELLAATSTSDVVDALLALLAVPGGQLLTSDPDDLRVLIEARGIPMTVIPI
jgi:hypothetical protein